ncbi:hypothetical protein SAMN05661080_00150 [Modestobacter sp. DSM 44400]|uniref:hypothetical protein n=1 Tax=Modestobacter sp. DSM 44400 TaxID=1550230 RepID=UPI0008972899|nr:hypothetical protein [Modestobacter sp. DSM 44400]SDX49082.1 hypothetical protein SAMN05661080_00150 [Modestobacter sp. DSM 44400]
MRSPRLLHWLCVLVAAGVLTGFALLLLTGKYVSDGPVVVAVTHDHGVHAGDPFVVAGWALGMLAVGRLALAPGRGSSG